MFWVYAIYNHKHDKIYVGQTRDLTKRLTLHNTKVFQGYTSRFEGKWHLVYQEECDDRQSALKRER